MFRFLDLPIPTTPAFQSAEVKRKARMIVGFSLILFLLFALRSIAWITGISKAFPFEERLILSCLLFLMFLNVLSMKKARSHRIPSATMLLLLWVLFDSIAYLQGGFGSPAMLAKSALPLVAIFMLGSFWGWIAMLQQLIDLALFAFLQKIGLLPPFSHLSHSPVQMSVMLSGFSLILITLGWLLERSRIEAIQALQKSHQENLSLAIDRDSALRINHAKSEFMANMSHELRTPLNAIIGYSELIEEDIEDDGPSHIQPDLVRIKSAGLHLLALIDDILDISKIEAGQISFHPKNISLHSFLSELEPTIALMAHKNENLLIFHPPTHDVQLQTDPKRLRQILLNLLSNACKFTHLGTITLHTSLSPSSNHVLFEIKDTGIGMSPSKIELIFQPFTQIDNSSTRKYGGAGLGLSITKELCELMGGELQAQSVEDQGTTMTVRLPLSPPPNHPKQDTSSNEIS